MSSSHPILYKYRCGPNSVGQRREFHRPLVRWDMHWFAEPATLNDPFDCAPRVSLDCDPGMFLEKAKALGRSDERLQQLSTELRTHKGRQAILARGMSAIGVCCLSDDPTCGPLWAHYAGNHTGYCLGYSTEEMGLLADRLTGKLARDPIRMMYQDRRPLISMMSVSGILEAEAAIDRFEEVLSVKSPRWAYEQEWRLFGRANMGVTLGGVNLAQIIFGKNISGPDRADLSRWCLSRAEWRKTPDVWQAFVPSQGVRLRFRRVESKQLDEYASQSTDDACGELPEAETLMNLFGGSPLHTRERERWNRERRPPPREPRSPR